ncbi:hypothetical protein C2845_PM03G21190 [Panicum miliaceum]|uniref:Uncharacterized protein n=1 Tax=Panicum miliaceum TaxID=4540 RepID=A0A3L6T9K0_PANMI|nr:hypothetical protein C2845_PM03G21190 [Panicum miliaceum]
MYKHHLIMLMSNCCTTTTVSGKHRHKPIHETRYNLDTNASKTMPFTQRPDDPGTSAPSMTDGLLTTMEPEHQTEGGLLLDVVVGKGAAILQLLAGKNQPSSNP